VPLQLSKGRIGSASFCMLNWKNVRQAPPIFRLPSSKLNATMIDMGILDFFRVFGNKSKKAGSMKDPALN